MSLMWLTLSVRRFFRRVAQGLRRNVADGEVLTPADLLSGRVELSLAEARELAHNRMSSYKAQIAAGRAFLYGSAHTVSVITEAECCFRRAFELEPGNVEALTYIAFSLDNQGRWTEAKELYERALAIDPSFALAKERYALALEELNIIDEVEVTRLRRSPFTRFPETVASLGSLDQAIRENCLSHVARDALALVDSTRVVTIGSCFAANLAHALTAEGVQATNLTVGEIINSTFANLEYVKWALGLTETVSGEISGRYPREEIAKLIRDVDVVIYTLGVAPCFFEKATGRFVLPGRGDGIRGMRGGKYMFRTTTVEENLANLRAIVKQVRDVNPKCKFVFSLSPVPLTATLEPRSAMEADCLSKSVLRVAVDQLVTDTPGCLYWPAFEIVRWLGAYLPNMYGEEDGTTHHVSERVVRKIMRLFLDLYFRPSDIAQDGLPVETGVAAKRQ